MLLPPTRPNDPKRRRGAPPDQAQALHDQLDGAEAGIRALKAAGDTSSLRYYHLRNVQSETTQRLLALHASSNPSALNDDVVEGVRRQAERLTGKPVPAPFGSPPVASSVPRTSPRPTTQKNALRSPTASSGHGTPFEAKGEFWANLGPFGTAPHLPRPIAPPQRAPLIDFPALLQRARQVQAERAKDPRNHRVFQGVTYGTDPFEGLEFDQSEFEKALNTGVGIVKGRRGQAVPMYGPKGASNQVRDATGLTGSWKMTKPQSQVEQEWVDSLGVNAQVGRTVGFNKGQTNAQIPRGSDRKKSLQAHTYDPVTGERMTPSYHIRKAVNGYTQGGSEALQKAGLSPFVADLIAGGIMHPFDIGADLQTVGDRYESPEHVGKAALNVAGKVGLDALGGPVARKVGEIAGPALGRVGAGVLGRLKGTKAWGLIAKAESPQAAMRILRGHFGLGAEEAQRVVGAVEASGERVRWRGKAQASRSGGAMERGVARFQAVRGAEDNGTSLGSRVLEASPIETPESLPRGRKPLKAPRNVKYTFEKMDDAGYTRKADGRIFINDKYEKFNHNRNLKDPGEDLWWFLRALRHEWFHQALTPKAGLPESELKGWSLLMRQLRNDFYDKNQFGRYAEETAAEAYGTRSLRRGLEYLTSNDDLGRARLAAYGLTRKGILKDAAKLGGGVGGGMGAALYGAYDVGQGVGDLLSAYDDYTSERDAISRFPTKSLAPTRRPRKKKG